MAGSEPEAPLEIVLLGDPVLRRVAEPVPDDVIGSKYLKKLAKAMEKTMLDAPGVGLAAPQVGESLRLFVFWIPESHGQPVSPTCLINPQIRPVGEETETDWEGCLSIPGLMGKVKRYRRVKVRAFDVEGRPISFTANGFHARVIQHEYDHLDGIVYLDRMDDLQSLSYQEVWEKLSDTAKKEED